MGNSSSNKAPPVVSTCRSPVYCVRRIGSRHLLLAGGGGAAATGVTNQIETLLLSTDQQVIGSDKVSLRATLSQQIRTDPYATMNMDIIPTGPPDSGRFLIACGQDQFCTVYESLGFVVDPEDAEKKLAFNIRPVGRFTTDEKAHDPYQKCCAFDRSTGGARLVSGGADGHVRVWSVRDLVDHRDPTLTRKPLLDIGAHKADVDAVDVFDGRFIVSVGDGTAYVWDIQLGKQISQLPTPPALAQGFKVRTVLSTPLGEKSAVLLAAFNQSARTSSSLAFLVLYMFNRETHAWRVCAMRDVVKGDAISTVALSQDGMLVAVGTMGGSVIVLQTDDLQPLLTVPQTHGIFVTGVEFLDKVARDVSLPRELALNGALPGPASPYRATLVSLSADQTVQVHNVPFAHSPPLSTSVLKIAILSLVLYAVLWALLGLF